MSKKEETTTGASGLVGSAMGGLQSMAEATGNDKVKGFFGAYKKDIEGGLTSGAKSLDVAGSSVIEKASDLQSQMAPLVMPQDTGIFTKMISLQRPVPLVGGIFATTATVGAVFAYYTIVHRHRNIKRIVPDKFAGPTEHFRPRIDVLCEVDDEAAQQISPERTRTGSGVFVEPSTKDEAARIAAESTEQTLIARIQNFFKNGSLLHPMNNTRTEREHWGNYHGLAALHYGVLGLIAYLVIRANSDAALAVADRHAKNARAAATNEDSKDGLLQVVAGKLVRVASQAASSAAVRIRESSLIALPKIPVPCLRHFVAHCGAMFALHMVPAFVLTSSDVAPVDPATPYVKNRDFDATATAPAPKPALMTQIIREASNVAHFASIIGDVALPTAWSLIPTRLLPVLKFGLLTRLAHWHHFFCEDELNTHVCYDNPARWIIACFSMPKHVITLSETTLWGNQFIMTASIVHRLASLLFLTPHWKAFSLPLSQHQDHSEDTAASFFDFIKARTLQAVVVVNVIWSSTFLIRSALLSSVSLASRFFGRDRSGHLVPVMRSDSASVMTFSALFALLELGSIALFVALTPSHKSKKATRSSSSIPPAAQSGPQVAQRV